MFLPGYLARLALVYVQAPSKIQRHLVSGLNIDRNSRNSRL